MQKIKQYIEERVKQLKVKRNEVTGANARNKYNFTISELNQIKEML